MFEKRVTIKAGERQITFHADTPVEQVCPRCSTVSVIQPSVDAA